MLFAWVCNTLTEAKTVVCTVVAAADISRVIAVQQGKRSSSNFEPSTRNVNVQHQSPDALAVGLGLHVFVESNTAL